MAAMSGSQILLLDPRIPPAEANFLGRFVYDVLHYTLPKCGFRKRLCILNMGENVYKRPNLVRIASVTVLRFCFVMRETWRRRLLSLPRDKGKKYSIHNVATVMSLIVKVATEKEKASLQSNIEMTLALCVDMILLFDSENIECNVMSVVGSTVANIMCLIRPPAVWEMDFNAPPPKYSEIFEGLFREFDNIWEYERWLEDFNGKFAVPYGSRKNVTKLFYGEVKKRWKEIVEKEEGKPSVEKVKIHLGFLSEEVYDEIVAETPVPMPPYSEVSSKDNDTPLIEKPSASSKRGGKKSQGRRSSGSGSASEQTSQGEKSTTHQTSQGKKSSSGETSQGGQSGKGLEEDLSRMNLGASGGSQEGKGAIPKRKDSKKK